MTLSVMIAITLSITGIRCLKKARNHGGGHDPPKGRVENMKVTFSSLAAIVDSEVICSDIAWQEHILIFIALVLALVSLVAFCACSPWSLG